MVRIVQEVRISEGHIIRAVLYEWQFRQSRSLFEWHLTYNPEHSSPGTGNPEQREWQYSYTGILMRNTHLLTYINTYNTNN